MDFAVYTGGVYFFTEAYYYTLGLARETNIAVFWCLLTIAFSMYPSRSGRGRQEVCGSLTNNPFTLEIGKVTHCCATNLPNTWWGKVVAISFALLAWAQLGGLSSSPTK